jgi:hypothetical protein
MRVCLLSVLLKNSMVSSMLASIDLCRSVVVNFLLNHAQLTIHTVTCSEKAPQKSQACTRVYTAPLARQSLLWCTERLLLNVNRQFILLPFTMKMVWSTMLILAPFTDMQTTNFVLNHVGPLLRSDGWTTAAYIRTKLYNRQWRFASFG